MIAAIYARKSNDQSGVVDEAKSVARQVDHAKAYAARKGWAAAEEHVYVDDGISGALFGDSRPGLARLLNALTPQPPFQILVMSEESRLGREQIETAWTLKRILDAGVRVFFYLEDCERTLDTAMDKVMLSLTNFASEMERERARQRTHDALLRRARAGHVAGGAVFGYRNEEVVIGDQRAHVRRVVEPHEADVIRRIFAMAAGGLGVKRIAATLNAEGVVAPIPRRPGRPRAWAAGSVRDILHRELYRGRAVWNRRERRGRRGLRVRPESEWVRVGLPDLRIVSDEAWQSAHARLAASRAVYLKATGGRTYGRPVNGIASPYLLTGLTSCGACGSSMFVHRHGRSRHGYYGCVVYHQRGPAVCKNSLEVRMEDADQAVLTAVEHDLLRVEVLETSLAKAMDLLRPPAGAGDDRTRALRRELAKLDAEVDRLTAAIAAGGAMTALLAALKERERHRGQLRAELAALEHAGRRVDDKGKILDQLRSHLADWQGTLRQETGPARQALTGLLAGRLIFMPREHDHQRFYEFEGPGTVSKIIAGLALPRGMVIRCGRWRHPAIASPASPP